MALKTPYRISLLASLLQSQSQSRGHNDGKMSKAKKYIKIVNGRFVLKKISYVSYNIKLINTLAV